jgi:hypothetical protein
MTVHKRQVVTTIEVEPIKRVGFNEVEVCSKEEATEYGVYLRTREGFAIHLADFKRETLAIAYANQFTSLEGLQKNLTDELTKGLTELFEKTMEDLQAQIKILLKYF